ncbi:hypothetical protein [Actinomadura kijaniata]|uniref:hypothetical protein n=1 Tax=Actinomadura kijaniata TaxID=46161 RepID=UPI00082CEAFC|nr:hypothetical protein [Actinomadura kijaniata]
MSRFLRPFASAVALAAAILALLAPATSAHAESVPTCVNYSQSWRYATATNTCSHGVTFKTVYQDGHQESCQYLAPGQTRTIGSGYTGPHGSLARLEQCTGTTTIWGHHDAGWGNQITIRGNTAPLTWSAGHDCANRSAGLWECAVVGIPAGQPFEFKVLINDKTWSAGANYTGAGTWTQDVHPSF